MQQREHLVEIAVSDEGLLDQRLTRGSIIVIDLQALLDQVEFFLKLVSQATISPTDMIPISDSAAVLMISARRTAPRSVETQSASPMITFEIRSVRKKLLPRRNRRLR